MKLTTGYKKPIDSDSNVLLAGGGNKTIQQIINDFGVMSIAPAITFNQPINADILGNATTANRLTTSAGSNIQPIFFSEGIPIACTYTLNKSVPSDALFTDHTYNFGGTTFYSGNSNNAEQNANNALANGHYYYTSNGPTTTIGASTSDGALYVQSYSDSWVAQIAQDYRNGRLFVRGKNNGTWQNWIRIAQSGEAQPASDVKTWAKADTKPSYSFSEITSPPTTISGYGITDAKIENGVITLGNATITPLTSVTNISGYSTYLPTKYDGGDKPNPQSYFSNSIGLRVAMTRSFSTPTGSSAWYDTLWINGYSGEDVKNMNALHFTRNGTPRMFISTQENTSSTYGTYYEIISTYNLSSNAVDLLSNQTISGNKTFSGNTSMSILEVDSVTAGNLIIQGTSSLGTIVSGTWNGDIILSAYLGISSWAKAASKPTYTASEVGALASDHAASGVTSEKITNWNAAYTHSTSTHAPTNAQKNVQSDWNQTTTTADDYIKNKPTFTAVATSGSYSDLSGKPSVLSSEDFNTLILNLGL